MLGGGLVPGSLILLGGEPGIGKSTLLLQAAAGLRPGPADGHVLYATGEESAGQVRLRAGRLGLLDGPARRRRPRSSPSTTSGGSSRWRAPAARRSSIVDSVQTATVDELDGPAGQRRPGPRGGRSGSWTSPRARGSRSSSSATSPRTARSPGPRRSSTSSTPSSTSRASATRALRLLRAAKNRFGSTEEVGVFEMAEAGLIEVADPARAFLADHDEPAPGSVVAPTMEGSRPLLVEVQALVDARPAYGTPDRDGERHRPEPAGLLIAVLGRRAGHRPRRATTSTPTSPAACRSTSRASTCRSPWPSPRRCAIARSRPGRVVIGEVGLLGELRGVAGLERRLREAARLGFRRAIVPRPAAAADAPASPGSRSSTLPTRPRRRRGALAEPRAWRCGAGDARLTARPGRSGRRTPGLEPPRATLIRYIRVLGAALGGFIGLALATALATGCSAGPSTRRAPRRLGRRLDRRRLRASCRTSPSSRRPG